MKGMVLTVGERCCNEEMSPEVPGWKGAMLQTPSSYRQVQMQVLMHVNLSALPARELQATAPQTSERTQWPDLCFQTLFSNQETKAPFSSVLSLSRVQLFATRWTAACQASLSITNSQSLLKLMSIESVMPSNHLILCRPSSCFQSFPASESFLISWFFASGGQNIGVSASASVLSMNIQDWSPLGWTGWMSL